MSPGFRFHPTDEELITCYLMNKINDATFTGRAIADVDLYKCEPWELPGRRGVPLRIGDDYMCDGVGWNRVGTRVVAPVRVAVGNCM
ncbi:hypothetical protein ACFXTH_011641 [Malus domestica]